MRVSHAASVSIVLLVSAAISHADIAANKQHEMAYLLSFVRDSGCTVDIGGEHLHGLSASAYLHRQYGLYKERISNVDEFISFVAGHDHTSDRDSMVECQKGNVYRTIDWLQRALNVYRLKRRY